MKWFLFQEVAGEAGFEDLLAMTKSKCPSRRSSKWPGISGTRWGAVPRKACTARCSNVLRVFLGCFRRLIPSFPKRALGNTMIALARHRRYAFHSIGALGVIEMTAPGRAALVDAGLGRLRIPAKKRHYFAVHAVLDVKHSEAWNLEVLRSLVEEDSRRARAIGEGAL